MKTLQEATLELEAIRDRDTSYRQSRGGWLDVNPPNAGRAATDRALLMDLVDVLFAELAKRPR